MEDYAPNVSSMDIRRSGTMERKNSAHKKFGPPLNANISAIASEDIRMPNLSPPIINSPSQSLIRCSKSIALAVEMFATVGETICDQNREIHGDMQDACAKSRSFCESLEKNCDRFHRQVFTALETTITSMRRHSYDRHDFQGELNKLTHNASCLLATMTRILLLADSIMVKEVLVSKDMTMPHGENALTPLGQLHHFTEFVKAFSDFGVEMIRFCILIVSMRKNRLSMSSQSLSFATEMQERRDGHYCRQVQIEFAQNILERSSVLLLSSSSTVQSHPESGSARENRDTVFCQMRRALDLIHYIIKDGVMHCGLQLRDDEGNSIGPIFNEDDSVVSPGAVPTVMQSIECFVDAVTIMQMSLVSESYKDHLFNTLDGIIESIQDFTDSAHTKHERRQTILMLCEKAKDELSRLLGDISEDAFSGLLDISSSPQPPSRDVEDSMRALRATTDNLRLELQEIAVEHSFLLGQVCDLANAITSSLMESAIQGDFEQLEYYSVQFSATLVSIEEISKVIRNAFVSDVLNVQTKHAEINLKIFGPQIIIAAQTLIHHPHSKAAHHNLECFCTLWKSLANELMLGCKQVQGDGIFFGNHLKLPSLDHGGAPMIVEQPPTPTTVTNPSPYVNFHPSLGNSLQFPDCSSNLGNNPHQSVPDLSSFGKSGPGPQASNLQVPYAPSRERSLGDPTMEPRRHSTSSLNPNLGQRPASSSSQFFGGVSSMSGGAGFKGESERRQCLSSFNNFDPTGHEPPLGPYDNHINHPQDLLNTYKDVENNEIVKRAKKMASQSDEMYDFTIGFGRVKTTQDLFTLAEKFAEEANLLYKVIRLFSYDVPAGEDKRSLMAIADHVPKHCHTLQMLIQSPIVGKAATFTKVDSIIKETRQIMQLVVRVVHICYINANKYHLDFSNISMEGRGSSNDDSAQPFGSSGGATSGSSSGNDSS
ncbi:alpha-catulin-like isoform X1 [Tigriopus californicus]|nr:alpha-catulin-like isoform X1 [Tigriopus californicus]